MREIKFRAWEPDIDFMTTNIGIDKIHLFDFQGDNITEQEGLIIMQYTGLGDHNGNDAYELDIALYHDHLNCVIVYDSKQAKYKLCPIELYKQNAGDGGWTGYELRSEQFEIIGNIYGNPELLMEESEKE